MNTHDELPRWNAAEWLEKLNCAKRAGTTHPARVEVFKSTLEVVQQGCYVSESGQVVDLASVLNENALKDNAFCEQRVALKNPQKRYETQVKVVLQDCLEHARALLAEDSTPDVCVLNMASAKNPGGGVWGGAGAQEEYLFRCSDYYRFLYQYADPRHFDCQAVYGIAHHPSHCYPLVRDHGGVFSRGVTIFRDTESRGYALLDEPWRVNMVAVAAYNIRGMERIPNDFVASTEERIRTILRIAYNNGQRRLVLGAFGCGAFKNPPRCVAQCFGRVLAEHEFFGLFREVHFAIIEDHNSLGRNFKAFREVLGRPEHEVRGIQEAIEELLRDTGREGIDKVMAQLREGGFYDIPASVTFHNNCAGGLAAHSLMVCQKAVALFDELCNGSVELAFGKDSVVLCALLHDVCKMGEYFVGKDGKPHHAVGIHLNKTHQHGTKSVNRLLRWGLQLSDEEQLAIRWHMGEYATDAQKLDGYTYFAAQRMSPLVQLVHEADSLAAGVPVR